MQKKVLPILLLMSLLSSCYPPKILYSIEHIESLSEDDSIRVQLIGGDIISSGTTDVYLGLQLKLSNDSENDIFIRQNSTLELKTDSAMLKFEIFPDSLDYCLEQFEGKLLQLNFKAIDLEHITYTTVDWPSFWSMRTLEQKTPLHKLYLSLDLYNKEGEKIENNVVLKPIGTKKMKYENDE